jgi:hypothetical protein
MSDIDLMNAEVVTQAHSVPDASGVSGVWDTPATPVGFTVQIDPNAGYWTIYDSTAFVVSRGQGSVLLGHTMRRLGIIR